MGTKTEGKHPAEFIIHEYGYHYCREAAVVASGQNLVDGQLVQLSATKLVAKATTLNTAGTAFTTAIEGILIGNWDATATGEFGAADSPMPRPYLKRGPAAVRDGSITYPAGTTQKAIAIANLAAMGIIVRTDG